MDTRVKPSQAELEVRQLLDTWTTAVRSRDVAAITANYAEDIVAYDAILKLEFKGRDAYRQHWEACMAMCTGDMIFEPAELTVVADGAAAFAHGLCRCGGTDPVGEQKISWTRMTTGLRRRGGQWEIVHEHFSVPVDMESGKALWSLQP